MKVKTFSCGCVLSFLALGLSLILVCEAAWAAEGGKAHPTRRDVAPTQRSAPTQRPTTQPTKASSRKSATTKPSSRPKIITAHCRNREQHGIHCIGRKIKARVREEKVRCPLGNEWVTIRRILGLRVKKRDSDLRPHLKGFGQKDYIWFCPKSGYAAFPEDFFKPFDKNKMKQALLPVVRTTPPPGVSVPSWYPYTLAAAAYWARGKDPRFFGRFFLRATWAAREAKDRKQEQIFRRRAIAAMQIAFQRKMYSVAKRPTIAYLIGELQRQDRRFDKAALWLGRALSLLKEQEKRTGRLGAALERMIVSVKRWSNQGDSKIHPLP